MNWQKFRTLIDFIFLIVFLALTINFYTKEGTGKLFWFNVVLTIIFGSREV
jgi:hypothetical protein